MVMLKLQRTFPATHLPGAAGPPAAPPPHSRGSPAAGQDGSVLTPLFSQPSAFLASQRAHQRSGEAGAPTAPLLLPWALTPPGVRGAGQDFSQFRLISCSHFQPPCHDTLVCPGGLRVCGGGKRLGRVAGGCNPPAGSAVGLFRCLKNGWGALTIGAPGQCGVRRKRLPMTKRNPTPPCHTQVLLRCPWGVLLLLKRSVWGRRAWSGELHGAALARLGQLQWGFAYGPEFKGSLCEGLPSHPPEGS